VLFCSPTREQITAFYVHEKSYKRAFFFVSNMPIYKELSDQAAKKYRKEKTVDERLNDLDSSLSTLSLDSPRRKAFELEKNSITLFSLSDETKSLVEEIISAPILSQAAAGEPDKRGQKPSEKNKAVEPTRTYNLRGKKD
jgi:hypothetical protein